MLSATCPNHGLLWRQAHVKLTSGQGGLAACLPRLCACVCVCVCVCVPAAPQKKAVGLWTRQDTMTLCVHQPQLESFSHLWTTSTLEQPWASDEAQACRPVQPCKDKFCCKHKHEHLRIPGPHRRRFLSRSCGVQLKQRHGRGPSPAHPDSPRLTPTHPDSPLPAECSKPAGRKRQKALGRHRGPPKGPPVKAPPPGPRSRPF